MSRHLRNTSNRVRPDDPPPRPEPESQHLGVFAATLRAMKGLAGRPMPDPSTDPAGDVDVPMPRPTADIDESVPPTEQITEEIEEITVEFPRYYQIEPSEPALSMLSRGRHGMW
ncbi:MAG: hypothetical protein ACRDSP_11455 [Pseudonocardiaceae bacterium]